MNQLRCPSRIAAMLSVLLLSGCGGDAPLGEAGGEAESAGEAAPAAAPAVAEIVVEMAPLPTYVAEGTVTLRRNGENIAVDVLAETHLNTGDYPMHIHEGTCAEGGRVVVGLTSVQGQENGEGNAQTTFPASQLNSTTPYFVQIHAPTGEPVACANLPLVNLR